MLEIMGMEKLLRGWTLCFHPIGSIAFCAFFSLPFQLSSVNVCAMGIFYHFYSSLRSHPLPPASPNISLYINLNDDGRAEAAQLFFLLIQLMSLTPLPPLLLSHYTLTQWEEARSFCIWKQHHVKNSISTFMCAHTYGSSTNSLSPFFASPAPLTNIKLFSSHPRFAPLLFFQIIKKQFYIQHFTHFYTTSHGFGEKRNDGEAFAARRSKTRSQGEEKNASRLSRVAPSPAEK